MSTQQWKTVNKNGRPVQNHCTQCVAAEMMQMMYADLERDGYQINRDSKGIVRTISKGGHSIPVY